MKKTEYYVKKFFVCTYYDDADGKCSALEEIERLCLLDKQKEKEMFFETNKINNQIAQILSNDNGRKKFLELIESFRKEIEKEDCSVK